METIRNLLSRLAAEFLGAANPTAGGLFSLLKRAAQELVTQAELLFGPGTGAEKKAAVMIALEELFYRCWRMLPWPWYLRWVGLFDDRVWQLLRPFLDEIVERAVSLLNNAQTTRALP